MPNSGWHRKKPAGWWLLVLWWWLPAAAWASEYQPLPPVVATGLGAEWLIYQPQSNKLVLYLPGYHEPARAYYQWITPQPRQPFRVSFAAQPRLSLFVDNRLVFEARTAGRYTVDLLASFPREARASRHLLCIWHPEQAPDYASFTNATPERDAANPKAVRSWWQPQIRATSHQGENIFLCFLLLIGLLYGGVRTVYQPGFVRIYELWSNRPGEQSFLTRPTITWLNVLLVLIFSLSSALLIVTIHTDIQNLVVLRQLFAVTESDLVLRVLAYTVLVAAFVLLKLIYVSLMGYIFNVSQLVLIQYREFVRSLLFMGLFLPIVILLYLVLNQSWPAGVLWVSNGVVLLMLVATLFRVARTVHRKASLLNLHLFSYLCATEIMPLAVLLKLLVITY